LVARRSEETQGKKISEEIRGHSSLQGKHHNLEHTDNSVARKTGKRKREKKSGGRKGKLFV